MWNIDAGRMTHKGKAAVVDDAFADGKLTPARSRVQTPAGSTAATPAGSGAEDSRPGSGTTTPATKKKKKTRNQLKAQEERRRLRKLAWLTHGGPKPEDTDSD
jgi:elongation factor 3